MDASVQVSRGLLKEALDTLRQTMLDDAWRMAFLEFEDGCLAIHCGGNSVRVEASGHWPGRARVASDILARMSQALPPDDPLTIAIDDENLCVGSVRLSCSWDTSGRPRPELPMSPNLQNLLLISRRYEADIIESSGIAGMVAVARRRLDEKLDRTSKFLGNLGVTREDLEELVERKLETAEMLESLLGPNQKRLPLRFNGEQLILGDDPVD